MQQPATRHRRAKQQSGDRPVKIADRPSRATAEDAVRTLIRWSGDKPRPRGLLGTPSRVARAYEEWFAGYFENPREYLKKTFEGSRSRLLVNERVAALECRRGRPIIGSVLRLSFCLSDYNQISGTKH
jgi:GTP cyclohydrolase I